MTDVDLIFPSGIKRLQPGRGRVTCYWMERTVWAYKRDRYREGIVWRWWIGRLFIKWRWRFRHETSA